MTYRDVKTLSARGKIQLKFAKRGVKLVGAYQCLIVSADAGGLAFADASVAPISANTAPAHSIETIQFTRRIAPSTVPVTPSPTSLF